MDGHGDLVRRGRGHEMCRTVECSLTHHRQRWKLRCSAFSPARKQPPLIHRRRSFGTPTGAHDEQHNVHSPVVRLRKVVMVAW